MKYWTYDGNSLMGPMAPEDIKRQPWYQEDTMVCAENQASPTYAVWKKASEVPDFSASTQSASSSLRSSSLVGRFGLRPAPAPLEPSRTAPMAQGPDENTMRELQELKTGIEQVSGTLTRLGEETPEKLAALKNDLSKIISSSIAEAQSRQYAEEDAMKDRIKSVETAVSAIPQLSAQIDSFKAYGEELKVQSQFIKLLEEQLGKQSKITEDLMQRLGHFILEAEAETGRRKPLIAVSIILVLAAAGTFALLKPRLTAMVSRAGILFKPKAIAPTPADGPYKETGKDSKKNLLDSPSAAAPTAEMGKAIKPMKQVVVVPTMEKLRLSAPRASAPKPATKKPASRSKTTPPRGAFSSKLIMPEPLASEKVPPAEPAPQMAQDQATAPTPASTETSAQKPAEPQPPAAAQKETFPETPPASQPSEKKSGSTLLPGIATNP